jgi:hypothetical protein
MMYKTFKYNTLIILLPCSYFEMYIWNTQIMKTAAFFCFNSISNNSPLFAQRSCNMVLWRKCWSRFQFRNSVTLTDGKLTTNEGCATISDKDGNYFYTDGSFVYNKTIKWPMAMAC